MRDDNEDEDMGPEPSKNAHGLIVRTKGKFVEVLETFHNIAPIVDAVSADVDGSGQVRLSRPIRFIPLLIPGNSPR